MSAPRPKPVSKTPLSYYARQVEWVSANLRGFESPVVKSLVISYRTIQAYHVFLFDPKVNLADEVKDTYIKDIMLVDFGKIILDLKANRGADRDKTQAAYDIMDKAQSDLYRAYTAATGKKENAKVEALKECRRKLEKTCQQLEYLDKKIETYYKPR